MICTYCNLPDADLLIGVLETNSGPGFAQRAHSSCADSRTAIKELRDLVRGIHPPALNDGLDVALETLVSGYALPVTLDVDLPERPGEATETIPYFDPAHGRARAAARGWRDCRSGSVRWTGGC
ncbi:hypothetical protein ABZ070_34645 [Streptomyces sp. NPDC006283]|uniref:hypothetical protein n=1 Tax=Streptomyces sp. NPDC006283 TaxID=3156741 RepID=UPI0033AA3E22